MMMTKVVPALQFNTIFQQSQEQLVNKVIAPLKPSWDDTVWKRSVEFISAQSAQVATDLGEKRVYS
jgi:hypothetical protein